MTLEPKVKFFGLVRDKNGQPKIDGDPKDLSPHVKELLTSEEKQELGIE